MDFDEPCVDIAFFRGKTLEQFQEQFLTHGVPGGRGGGGVLEGG